MAFAENFIRAFQQGQQLKQQKEQSAFELADRADRRKLMTLKLKQEELEDKARQRQEAIQNAQLMQGQPGRNPMQAGVEAQLPATDQAPVVPIEAQQVPHKPMQIPGAYGSEGVTVQPQTQQQVEQQTLRDRLNQFQMEKLKLDDVQAFQSSEGEKRDKARIEAAGISQAGANARTESSNKARLQAAGIAQSGATARNSANIASREKIADKRDATRKLITQARGTPVGKPLSAEAAKVLTLADTAPAEIEQLKAAFKKDYNGALLGLTTGTNRELVKLVDQVADKIGRMRSGGAVNKEEEARFKNQIYSWMDLAFGKEQDALDALDGYLQEFNGVANQIDPDGSRRKGVTSPTPAQQKGGTPKILSIERIE